MPDSACGPGRIVPMTGPNEHPTSPIHDHAHSDGHDTHHHHGDPGSDESGIARRSIAVVRGLFAPHSHDAADSIDTALTASSRGTRALKVSLAGLAVTAALQLVVFAFSGSVALLADTIHNVADALTAVPLGIAFVLGRRAATERYTYGFGRAEDLAGIVIVAVIALSSAVAAWAALDRLLRQHTVHNVAWVIVAGFIGFVGNELVAAYRIRIGRQIGSAALVADGLHARTDGLTSLAVVVGAVGVLIGWQLADPIMGLAITVAILVVLRSAARDIYRRLMDSVDPQLVDDVARVMASVPGVESVEAVRIRWVGHELRAEVEIVADGAGTLADAHAMAEEGHHRLLHDIHRLAAATIHVSPSAQDGRDHHAETAHHFPAAKATQPTPAPPVAE
jgi:cation diffusion facilitator family transporter